MKVLNTPPIDIILSQNLSSLKTNRNSIFRLIEQYNSNQIGQYINTLTGPNLLLTCEKGLSIPLYNETDPWQDAESHLQMTDEKDPHQKCIFFGLGFGYGPLRILKERPNIKRLVIFEPSMDIFLYAIAAVDLRPLILAEKVVFFVGEPDWESFRSIMCETPDDKVHFMNCKPLFSWRPDLYGGVNRAAYKIANEISIVSATTIKYGLTAHKNLISNISRVRHVHFLDVLKNAFKDKPCVLVSAGPSLNESLPLLKKVKDRCIIICVDAALKPMIDAGITPDFVTTIDLGNINFEKFVPVLDNEALYSIVASYKATPLITKRVPCKHQFLAFPENENEKWLHHALNIDSIVPNFFTVAHLSLGLAIVLGGSPLIFIGHDLAYTSPESDHAKGTVLASGSQESMPDAYCVYVTGTRGEKFKTHRGYYEFKTVFESIIAKYPGMYLNATHRGAHIEGTEVCDFKTVVEKYLGKTILVSEIIEEKVEADERDKSASLLETCKKIIPEIKFKRKCVGRTLSQVNNLKEIIGKRYDELRQARGPDDLPESINNEIVKLNHYKKDSRRIPHIEEIFYKAAVEIDNRVAQNESVFLKNYTDGVLGMLDIMEFENCEHLKCLKIFEDSLVDLYSHLSIETGLLNNKKRTESESENNLRLSRLFCETENFLLAEKYLNNMVSDESESSEYFFLMGCIRAGRLNYKKAHDYWREAVVLDKNFKEKIDTFKDRDAGLWLPIIKDAWGPVGLIKKRVLDLAGDRPWVVDTLKEIWKPVSSRINLYLSKQDFKNADKQLSEWETSKSVISEWYYLKSIYLSEKKDLTGAVNNIGIAVSMNPDKPEWLIFMARLLLKNKQYDEGLKILKSAVVLDPKAASLWEELGDTLFQHEDYDASIIAYENCFYAMPNKIELLWKIGDCYFEMRKFQAAKTAYEKVLIKDSGNAYVREKLDEVMSMIQ